MQKAIGWVKNNKVSTVLILVVAYLLFRGNFYNVLPFGKNYVGNYDGASITLESSGFGGGAPSGLSRDSMMLPQYNPVAPQPDVEERMVVTNAEASVVVEDIRASVNGIRSHAESLNGYMLNSYVNQPSEGGNGRISVRVPSDSLASMLEYLRNNSIRVASENVHGDDVTDEFIDVEERLAILESNKARMEEILTSATDVQDILKVQNSIFQIQSQIESLQGRLNYLEATSRTSSLTVYLATDEYSLPYAPQDSWNVKNVFKQAVRSLVLTFRGLAAWGVWAVVYAPVWIPVVVVAYVVYRRSKKSSGSNENAL